MNAPSAITSRQERSNSGLTKVVGSSAQSRGHSCRLPSQRQLAKELPTNSGFASIAAGIRKKLPRPDRGITKLTNRFRSVVGQMVRHGFQPSLGQIGRMAHAYTCLAIESLRSGMTIGEMNTPLFNGRQAEA